MSNPLFDKTQTPDFTRIAPRYFRPAFKKVFADIAKAHDALRRDKTPPTFENSIVPFDTLFAEFNRVSLVLEVFNGNIRSKTISKIVEDSSVEFDAVTKKIFQDKKIADRVKEVYQKRDSLNLDREDRWFLQNIYNEFEDNGAFLDSAKKRQDLKRLDGQLIKVTQKCYDNMMDSRQQQAFLVTDKAQLSGVPADKVSAFAEQAQKVKKNGWLFVPERLLVDELLEVAENREFRQAIHEAMNRVGTQAPYDNEPLVKEMAKLRDQRSRLLGYSNFAEHKLSHSMAGSVAAVEKMLDNSIDELLPRYEDEMCTLESWAAQKPGGPEKLEPWDVPYYAAKYRKDVLGFDSTKLSRHLELENVIKGWLLHADKNMNMAFSPTDKVPVWNPDVRTYDAVDRETGEKSVLYIDPYARANKVGGAWMSQVQDADEATGRLNAVIFNMNLAKPAPGQHAFLDKGQNETFFHEGGHGQNGLKGVKAKYRSRRGANNESAYFEIHSTIEERVPYQPEVLPTYAIDPDTGKLPDPALLAAMEKADHFLATREVLKAIQNAKRDLLLHATPWEKYTTSAAIEKKADIQSPYAAHVRSYPLRRFDHLTGDGYAAGYNGYFRANVAAAIAAEPYMKAGLYDLALLAKKRAFYAIGGGLEPNEAFEELTGKAANDIGPYMRSLGINTPKP